MEKTIEIIKPTKINSQVYFIPFSTNIGIINLEKSLILIDSGYNTDNAVQIDEIISSFFSKPVSIIINTHSNADHTGGNHYFQEKYNCQIWSTEGEKVFVEIPYLEGAILYGGYPFKEIRSSAFESEPSKVTNTIKANQHISIEENEFDIIPLPGHYIEMIGILHTSSLGEKTLFLGDSIFGAQVINKYCISYMMNVTQFIQTLHDICEINASAYIPSHGTIITSQEELSRVSKMNETEIVKIQNNLLQFCKTEQTFEQIIENIFSHYHIRTSKSQYVLISSTIRNHLTDLYSKNLITNNAVDGKMYWKTL